MQSSLNGLCKKVKEKYGGDTDVQELLTAIGYRDTSTLSLLERSIVDMAESNPTRELWLKSTLVEPFNDTSKYISDLWHCIGMIGGDELRVMLNNASCYKPIVWLWALSGIASRELQIPDHKRCDILQSLKTNYASFDFLKPATWDDYRKVLDYCDGRFSELSGSAFALYNMLFLK